MVSVNSNITTEYDYKTQQAQSSKETTAPNSIIAKNANSNSTSADENETLYSKLNKIISQYNNIKLEDAKKLIFSVCGYNEAQLQKLNTKELDKIITCFEEALKQCSKNQKVDTEKLEKRFRAYNTMVIKGVNTIEEANQHIEQYKNMTFVDVLKHKELIDKNASISDIPQEEIEAAVAKFINEEIENNKGKTFTPKQIKNQRKHLERLIANSNDEEKSILWKALTNVMAKENTCPALDTMISSFIKPEKLQDFLHSFKTEDLVNSGLPNEDVQRFSYLLSANLDEEGLKAHREDIVRLMSALAEANMDLLKSIDSKKTAALKSGTEPEFTEEEQAVIQKLEIFKRVEAGDISGTANNKVIDTNFKAEFLTQLIEDAKANGTYEDVMGLVKEFAQNNQELTPQDFDKLMNELTQQEYDTIKTPTEKKQDSAPAVDVGFYQKKETVDPARLQALRQQITPAEEQPKFRVDKTQTTPEVAAPQKSSSFKDIIASTPDCEKSKVIENLYNSNAAFKLAIKAYIKMSSNPIFDLNKLPISIRASLAKELFNADKISEEDLKKLNLSFDLEKTILND